MRDREGQEEEKRRKKEEDKAGKKGLVKGKVSPGRVIKCFKNGRFKKQGEEREKAEGGKKQTQEEEVKCKKKAESGRISFLGTPDGEEKRKIIVGLALDCIGFDKSMSLLITCNNILQRFTWSILTVFRVAFKHHLFVPPSFSL